MARDLLTGPESRLRGGADGWDAPPAAGQLLTEAFFGVPTGPGVLEAVPAVTVTATANLTVPINNAIRIDNADEHPNLGAVPSTPNLLTFTCWVKIVVDRNATSTFFFFRDSGFTENLYFGVGNDGVTGDVTVNDSTIGTFGALTVGTWYKAAIVLTSGTWTVYLGPAGGSATTYTGSRTNYANAIASASLACGSSGATYLDGAMSQPRLWEAALSLAELQAEWASPTPVRSANLFGAWMPSSIESASNAVVWAAVAGANLVDPGWGTPAYALTPGPTLDAAPGPAAALEAAASVSVTGAAVLKEPAALAATPAVSVTAQATLVPDGLNAARSVTVTASAALTTAIRLAAAPAVSVVASVNLTGPLSYGTVDWQPGTNETSAGFVVSGTELLHAWSNHQQVGVKDNGGDDLIVPAWAATATRNVHLLKSEDNGSTWTVIAPASNTGPGGSWGASEATVLCADQDSAGNLHALLRVDFATIRYARYTLTRTGTHVTAFAPVVIFTLPQPSPTIQAGTASRCDIRVIRNGAGTECVLAMVEDDPSDGAIHLRVSMCVSSGVTPTSASDFYDLAGTGNSISEAYQYTQVGTLDNEHENTAHVVQIGTGPDLLLVVGGTPAEVASPNEHGLRYLWLTSTGTNTWSVGSSTTLASDANSHSPQLLGVMANGVAAYVMYYDQVTGRGIQIARWAANRSLTQVLKPQGWAQALEAGTVTRFGYAGLQVSSDDVRIYVVLNMADTDGLANPSLKSGFFNGNAWTFHTDGTNPTQQPYNTWGMKQIGRWDDGLTVFSQGESSVDGFHAVTVRGGSAAPAQALAATATASVTAAATLATGAAQFAATPAASVTATAALTTSIRLAATPTASVTASSALTAGIRLAASSTATVVAGASLTTAVRLAATPSAAATATAALSTGLQLAASASASATGSAALSTGIALAAAASATVTASATMAGTPAALVSDAQATAQASAGLTTGIRLEAGASATVVAQATLAGSGAPLAASAAAQVSAAVQLTTAISLAGAAAASVVATAELASSSAALAAAATGSVSATASLTTAIRLAGSASATASATADLSGAAALAGVASCSVSSSASLTTGIRLAGVASATVTATGALGGAAAALSSSSAAGATASGSLTTGIALANSGAASISSSAALSTSIRLAATASVSATAVAALVWPGPYHYVLPGSVVTAQPTSPAATAAVTLAPAGATAS